MCRIVGFLDFNFKNDYDIEATVVSMRDTLIHGGPDDAGLYIKKSKGLALGHRRLSILDLSNLGHQPMSDDNGNLTITYNGEVYNFTEVREELKACGYNFKSNTDTEVVLKAYEQWGMDALHKFRGMWAFAIWDQRTEKLVLCRDRVGVKPLYYYFNNGLFIFASELKAFHKHPKFQKELDMNALSLYFQYGYIPSPHAIFKHTYKLEPGHYLELNNKGQIRKFRYWAIDDYYRNGINEREKWLARSENAVADELETILTESFKLRMVSDVPVGVFLSGGVDSSLVTALLQRSSTKPLKTFTIGFHEKEFDEIPWANQVAKHLGTDHTDFYCTPKEAYDVIAKLPEFYDEPFGDSSAVPTYLVSKLAKRQVKASLSADGGDELFCGYPKYWMFDRGLKMINRLPGSIRQSVSFCLNHINPSTVEKIYKNTKFFLPKLVNIRDKYNKLRRVFRENLFSKQHTSFSSFFYEEDFDELGLLRPSSSIFNLDLSSRLNYADQMALSDFNTYLPDDLMVKVDRATMSVALEGRDPFLDHKILEYAAQLPSEFKYKNKTSKYILRKILYKYVPKKFIERPKHGFGMPVYLWFKNELKELYSEYLSHERIKKEGIFNPDYVRNLLTLYLNGKDVDHYKLWFIFSFQIWWEQWRT